MSQIRKAATDKGNDYPAIAENSSDILLSILAWDTNNMTQNNLITLQAAIPHS